MKRSLSFLGIVALVAAVVTLTAPVADASCSPAKLAGSSGYAIGGYGYAYTTFAGTGGNASGFVNGRLWQTNAPNINEGTTYDPSTGLFPAGYGGPDDWAFTMNLGAAGVGGIACPATCLSVYLENPAADGFILWTTDEGGVNNNLAFDFTTVVGGFATVAAGPSPRPRLTSSARNGGNSDLMDVTYNLGNVASAVLNDSTACDSAAETQQVYAIQSAGAPSLLVSAGWAPRGGVVGVGGANGINDQFNCTDQAQDWWIATGFSVDGQPPRFVSSPVQIECDPNMATPTGPGPNRRIDRNDPQTRRERNN